MTTRELLRMLSDDPPVDWEAEARIAAAVDRAVEDHGGGSAAPPPWRTVPPRVASELGWCVCDDCGRGIWPGLAVSRRGGSFHPECIAELVKAAA